MSMKNWDDISYYWSLLQCIPNVHVLVERGDRIFIDLDVRGDVVESVLWVFITRPDAEAYRDVARACGNDIVGITKVRLTEIWDQRKSLWDRAMEDPGCRLRIDIAQCKPDSWVESVDTIWDVHAAKH